MKVTVGQFEVIEKNIEHNYLEIKDLIKRATELGFDLIIFPEYALTGYGCADLFFDGPFLAELHQYHKKIESLAKKIDIIFGSVFIIDDVLHTGAIIIESGQVNFSCKSNLTKKEIDETRYFKPGKNTYYRNDYLVTFTEDYQQQDNAIVLASSPHPVPKKDNIFVFANSVGISSVKKHVFINGGQSYIGNRCLSHQLATGLIEDNTSYQDANYLELLTKAIQAFDRDNFNKQMPWIVGNSGGIDSALTIAVLVHALGSHRVVSYNLASRYNSEKTINNARHLADKLEIKHKEVTIDNLSAETIKAVSSAKYSMPEDTLVEENIQARLRGHLLSTFAALEGGVICNNGNKLELALGYCTLYGDTIGAVSPLGDLLKIECFELAKEINEYYQDEIIPENLLPNVQNNTLEWQIAPSAELREEQVDPMKWYYHDHLLELFLKTSKDFIIKEYRRNKLADYPSGAWLSYYGLLDEAAFIEDLNWFVSTIKFNKFKRLQTPPVIATSDCVIGLDYQE